MTIINNKAIYYWTFTCIYLIFLLKGTWAYIQGPVQSEMTSIAFLALLGLLWTVGLWIGLTAIKMKRLITKIEPNSSLHITESTLLNTSTRAIPLKDILDVKLITDRDTEGDPFYRTLLILRNDESFEIIESSIKDFCVNALDRINEARNSTQ
jgi:hypothetical protein